MDGRESEFTKAPVAASIFCGTWNVNAKKQDGGLQDWLNPKSCTVPVDIYAIGFQEIVDLNASNVLLDGSKTAERSKFWQQRIEDSLLSARKGGAGSSNGSSYTLVMSKSLVGLLLCVYVSQRMLPFVTDVRATHQATGIMGVMGNKGGVCVRLNLYDTSLCFVCAHLAAHRENVVGRNADFKTIVDGILFANPGNGNEGAEDKNEFGGRTGSDRVSGRLDPRAGSGSEVTRPLRGSALGLTRDLTLLDNHELIFWLGDLNYRIDDSMSTDEVFSCIERGDLESLRALDQLNQEIEKHTVFQGFSEGRLEFEPTYKYQPGTDSYDRRPDKKIRAPAWCDRVLWMSKMSPAQYPVSLESYERCNSLLPSDHKPVSARFDVRLRERCEKDEIRVFDDIMRQLSSWRNSEVPSIKCSTALIDVGLVYFDVPKAITITVTNNSKAIAYWRFVPKVEDRDICKRWIGVDVRQGLLLPTESATVTITIRVDIATARGLNAGTDLLEDVLVLRLENGHDFSLPVTAEYARSCMGMSLEALVNAQEPVRSIPLPATVRHSDMLDDNGWAAERLQSVGAAGDKPLSALQLPKELWRVVDALWSGGAIKEKDLFALPGVPEELLLIREALDCGKDFTAACSPHSYAQILLDLLTGLPSPLIPFDAYPSSEVESAQMRMWVRKLLDATPPVHYNVLVYLLSFFREVLLQCEYNRCSEERLTEICLQIMTSSVSDNLFLSRDERNARHTRRLHMRRVVGYLLTTTHL